ncbi:endolytic transglycosylase MltG [Candidatus Haliotispira prima]|uniref:Endolytic murein transglycosylase n=1 Tax=Candidatus Haliotispira prima TaxID=3034016 RepID=A0ABY8MFN7_9SPIO|nr:endolytic transglycosylase MltG [Candidatus Haliotispira prima]
MSKTKKILVLVILAFVLAAASLPTMIKLADEPGLAQSDRIGQDFEIREGDTWQQLGLRLKSEKLIRSLLWYKIRLRLRKDPITLKAGSYPWPRFMTTKEIINYFQVAQPEQTYPVTIPEGLTRREIALLLETKGLFSAREFFNETGKTAQYAEKFELPFPAVFSANPDQFTLEGYLFPDTYFLPKNYSAEKMVTLMLQNFIDHLTDIAPDWRNFPPEELYQTLILSSIVQKEYRAKEEAPIIASVFQNRLNLNMRLESCATIVYVLTEEIGRPHPNRILFKDLEEASPYNTYLNQGLPPHPIANVGAIALNAVFRQAETDYLFFVVKDAAKGTHKFSSSFSDHEAARTNYINSYFH